MQRRTFIQAASLSAAAMSFAGTSFADHHQFKIGMCDWNVRDPQGHGCAARVDALKHAAEAGLNGVQVSVATSPDNVPLRDPKVIEEYKAASKEYGVQVCSVAAGGILNEIPLMSEPEAAIYVMEAVEAAHKLGAKNILMAFFGDGDLRLKNSREQLAHNHKDGEFNEWALDTLGVERVIACLRQVAPRAEELGIALGLENTITAKQNVYIIDRVGSDMVQVYYDIGNSTSNGYDVPTEIRMLGNDRICEIHLKDNGNDVNYFEHPNAQVDWPEVSKAVKEIGYDKWYTIEESGRQNQFVEDTKSSIALARRYFA